MYELTIKVCAKEFIDLEQLLYEIAKQVHDGVVKSGVGNHASSYRFDLEERMEEIKD